MSIFDEIMEKLGLEHGLGKEKMEEIKEMLGKVDIQEIADKVGTPKEIIEKIESHWKKHNS